MHAAGALACCQRTLGWKPVSALTSSHTDIRPEMAPEMIRCMAVFEPAGQARIVKVETLIESMQGVPRSAI